METTRHTFNDQLLENCRAGDSSSYRKLYEQYAKAMFNISLRILNNRDEAEDVLQEAFSKAFSDLSRFGNAAAFAGWLKRVVINSSIDLVRKRKIHFIPVEELEIAEEEVEEPGAGYDVETIRTCISQLPDGYRIVLTLYLFEEQSHKEIAALLSITEGTSKSQYNRARKKLIELIQNHKP